MYIAHLKFYPETQHLYLKTAQTHKCSMLAPTYSPPCGVPSAMEGLTSVFGMGTGVPLPLKHQHTTFIANIWAVLIKSRDVVRFFKLKVSENLWSARPDSNRILWQRDTVLLPYLQGILWRPPAALPISYAPSKRTWGSREESNL